VANDDDITTTEDVPVVVPVLANDVDPEGEALHITGVGTPGWGAAVDNGDGTITFTPAANVNGITSFGYGVGDASGGADLASVHVHVLPVNDAPLALDDTAATGMGTPVIVPVLDNDSDVDGDALHVTSLGTPSSGTAFQNVDGTVTYEPAPGFSGTATFDYTVSDGVATDVATASVEVASGPPVTGSAVHYLGTNGPGDTTSTPVLPFTSTAPTETVLYNYDTDRDLLPGLFIREADNNLGTGDTAKYQKWSLPVDTGQVLAGHALLDIWAAMGDFDEHEGGRIIASLSNCNASALDCTPLAQADERIEQDDAPGTFQLITIDFGGVTATIPPGRTLVIKLVVDGDSADSMMFAYGTVGYPGALRVNQP
jgi:hypothetical protein